MIKLQEGDIEWVGAVGRILAPDGRPMAHTGPRHVVMKQLEADLNYYVDRLARKAEAGAV